jgi:hypothetical protein
LCLVGLCQAARRAEFTNNCLEPSDSMTVASDLRREVADRSVSMARMSRLAGLIAGAALGLQLQACTARTLPLPPPFVEPLAAPNMQGLVLVKGTAQEGAAVGVLDEATNTGVIVTSPETNCDSSCRFQAQIAAHSGDPIRVWQFHETSSTRDLRVPK